MRVLSSSCPRRTLLPVTCALALLACEDTRSTVPPPEEISSPEQAAKPDTPPGGEAASAQPEAAPEPAAPAPVPGPSCDQREAAHTCIDYGAHRGAAAPRCLEGVELATAGCAREASTARCTLPATGVVIYSYEGRAREAIERECETIDGALELTSTD